MFFSATMPPEIERLINQNLSSPVRVEVTRRATVSSDIEQLFLQFKPVHRSSTFREKRELLRRQIAEYGSDFSKAIVFCNRKSDVEVLRKSMQRHRIDCSALHGDLDQSVRTKVLDGFRNGEIRILIASDVAARGLDVTDVSHVINFDVPSHSEDYVHRIGRTGRAGRTGKAITFCLPGDKKHVDSIERLIGRKITRENITNLTEESKEKVSGKRVTKSNKRKEPPASAGEPRKARRRNSGEDRKEATGNSPLPPAEDNVVGMGDHIPEFMTRQISSRSPALTNS